ncbi:SAM-dependent methyltransferase [Pseudomonadota bacterium]
MKDLLLTLFVILILLPGMYLVGNGDLGIYGVIAMAVILIPTIYALINGAPFVPTPIKAVESMLKEANIKEGEKIIDIGCGDGRMVHMATKNYKCSAIGLEISPVVYLLARIRHFIWNSKAKVLFRDFKHYNLSDADVIVCYLLPETLTFLQSKLEKDLREGARIISYAFPIGDWKVEKKIERERELNIAPIWVYKK